MEKSFEKQPSGVITGVGEDSGKDDLRVVLVAARDDAAEAFGKLLSNLNVDTDVYQSIYDISVKIDEDSDAPGAYIPGTHEIEIGGLSDDVLDYLDGDENERRGAYRRFVATMVHEMVHALQTLPQEAGTEASTIGDVVEELKGVEEGMADALGYVVVDMKVNQSSIEESAQKLEEFCAEHDAPATRMSARMIRKMSPELLKWYLTCGKAGDIKSNNKFKEVLGLNYEKFCENMTRFYKHEIDEDWLSDDEERQLIDQTIEIIDKI